MSATWHVSESRQLGLDRPCVMAILNLTPDSFSDGGEITGPLGAIEAAWRAVREGADMLDIGGESTRPGAAAVSAEEQIARVYPAIRAIRGEGGRLAEIPISVDTTSSDVARAAFEAGADAINDVSAGTEDPAILRLAAERGAGLVLMHRVAAPAGESYSDRYERPPMSGDVVEAVKSSLLLRVAAAMAAGVSRKAIVVDPGLGFGKTVEQNLELIRRGAEIAELGFPVLSGVSRKSFVGRVMAGPEGAVAQPWERQAGSMALSVMHMLAGARVFRVHDVLVHVEGLRAAWAVRVGGKAGSEHRGAEAQR